jgi:hypothetical protein
MRRASRRIFRGRFREIDQKRSGGGAFIDEGRLQELRESVKRELRSFPFEKGMREELEELWSAEDELVSRQ